MFFVQEIFLTLKRACIGASKYLNLHLKLRFQAIYSKQNNILCLSGSIIVALQVMLK